MTTLQLDRPTRRVRSVVRSGQRHPQQSGHKLFYRIQEAAEMTGLKPSVLRYWETEFRELSPEKDAADQRRYRPSDIQVVLAIRKLLYEERYTIKGARGRLREELRRMRHDAEEMTPAAASRVVTIAPPLPQNSEAFAVASVKPHVFHDDDANRQGMSHVIEFLPSAPSTQQEDETLLDKLRKQQVELSLNRLRAEVNALLLMLS